MTTAYVLKLESNKYYIGYNDLEIQQKEEYAWTQKYKPLKVLKKIQTTYPSHIDVIVKEYMLQYGIDNVRGGSYLDIDNYTYNDLYCELFDNEYDNYESSYDDDYDSA